MPLSRIPTRVTICAVATAFALGAAFSAPVQAQTLTVGSKNVAIADPLVPRPPTKPCTVTLFSNQQFVDYNAKPFNFTPPANCAGPWQKVVLSIDYNIVGTRQYDRTAQIWIGGAVLYYGTTQEPSIAPPDATSWHIERDLTDYSALFAQSQVGHADLGNFIGVDSGITYDGIITGTATLNFYPAASRAAAALLQPRPDAVLSLNANPTDGAGTLSNPGDQYTASFSALPKNIERAYLDVYAQGQSADEFWFFNLPNDIAADFADNTGTALRETLVTIDGTPAGVAPIFPWIFTGGADPILWRPTPGVQTLAFNAYRVDLTPFAGVLSNGQPHTLALGVYNSTNYFNVAGNLLLYLDNRSTKVTGSVSKNTLAALPVVNVNENVTPSADGLSIGGTVDVTALHQYTITGSVKTSHGTVTTQVAAKIAFSSKQNLYQTNDGAQYVQDAVQDTQIDLTTTSVQGFLPVVVQEHRNYPLTFDYEYKTASDGSSTLYTNVDQEFTQRVGAGPLLPLAVANLDNHVLSTVTRYYDASGTLGNTPASSSQSFTYSDPFGACYSRKIASQNRVLASVTDGSGCWAKTNILPWYDAFSAFASSLVGATVQLLQ